MSIKSKCFRRRHDFPELARNTYIHVVVGLRANTIYKYDVKKRKAYSSTYEKEVYICSKNTVIYIEGIEGKEVCSKEVYCATTRSTPGGSADFSQLKIGNALGISQLEVGNALSNALGNALVTH